MILRSSLSNALNKHTTLFTTSNISTESELINAVMELDQKASMLLTNIHQLNKSIGSGDISTEAVERLDMQLEESLSSLSTDILNIASCSTEEFMKGTGNMKGNMGRGNGNMKGNMGKNLNISTPNPYTERTIPKLEKLLEINNDSNRLMKVCKSEDPLDEIEHKLQLIKSIMNEVSKGKIDLEYILSALKQAEIPIFEYDGHLLVGEVELFEDDYETVYLRDAIKWFKNYSFTTRTDMYDMRKEIVSVFRSLESIKILYLNNPSLSNPEVNDSLKGIQLVSKLVLFVAMTLIEYRNYIEDFS